jgi:hypothetical protein
MIADADTKIVNIVQWSIEELNTTLKEENKD